MPDTFDFSGLTPRQEWLILYGGWRIGQKYPDGSAWPQPTKRTVKKLIARGLMTEVKVRDNGLIVTLPRFPRRPRGLLSASARMEMAP